MGEFPDFEAISPPLGETLLGVPPPSDLGLWRGWPLPPHEAGVKPPRNY
ncbi:MAG: hypothetical protein HC857_04540 [Synechococcales cyanobacterium RU_4_20]|nr:hypothetical protein [Synechococcales cyanobacterium RU_4_20]